MQILKNRLNIIFFIVLALGIVFLLNHYFFVFNFMNKVTKVGIIDAHFNKTSKIELANKYIAIQYQDNHGDKLIEFAKRYSPNIKIFYYDACDYSGNITDELIIDGLNWMIKNDVFYINLSISSKTYSSKLQKYINENKHKFFIVSSFNNRENTFDYPAMYENVYGVGLKNKSNKDYIKKTFKSNKIVLVDDKKISFFHGNSFLSLYETINKSIEMEDQK